MKIKPAAFLLILLVPAALFAAEEGGGPSATADFIGKVVNSVILFGGLAYLLRKPITAMLEKKSIGVKDEIDKTVRLRDEAEVKRQGLDERLAALDGEVKKLGEEAVAQAERSRMSIRTQAEEERARLKVLAGQELQGIVDSAVTELRIYMGDKAAELSRERIKSKLTPEMHRKLIDNSIDRLTVADD